MVTSLDKTALQEYKCCANDVVHMKLVRCPGDLPDDSTTFRPVMSHQIFGASESIFGYKGLVIKLYYTACRLFTYLNISYDEVINSDDFDGVKPDDVLRELSKQIPPGFCTNLDEFISALDKEICFKPYGDLVHRYNKRIGSDTKTFEIYKTKIDVRDFRSYHERLQTFLLWYVDAASFIDADDDRWSYYLIYEVSKTSTGDTTYAIVGYQTVYDYYAYPDLIRPRISQVLILPPYQRQGHGGELLQTFYRECWSNSTILDITVEDPSEDYQRLRDFMDVRNSINLGVFTPERLACGFTKELANEVRFRLKLNKKQCRRVYEIVKLKESQGKSLNDFRLEVKKRLYQPFQQNRKELSRMKQALEPVEYEATQSLTKEQKHQYLETAYQDCVKEYRHIIERVAAAATE